MIVALVVISSINLAIAILQTIRAEKVRRTLQDLKMHYFTDITEQNGFVKKQKKVQIKGQLHIGEIPIGHPFVVSEEITETIDLEKLKMLIDVYAGPLLKIGIGVVKRRIGL